MSNYTTEVTGVRQCQLRVLFDRCIPFNSLLSKDDSAGIQVMSFLRTNCGIVYTSYARVCFIKISFIKISINHCVFTKHESTSKVL